MQEPGKPASLFKKRLVLLLKIAVTVACLWYVAGRIDFSSAGTALEQANWIYLAMAFILYVLSKLVSAVRLNINFRNISIRLTAMQNIRLYWLGMFYNLFLPGSISGDAYKVIVLSRTFNKPFAKTTAAVLLDRFSGLAGLILLLAVYGMFIPVWTGLLVASAILGFAVLYLVIRFWLHDFIPGFMSTAVLGLAVQVIQVLAVYAIMLALGISPGAHAYIFIFLLSSVASVLPLTIGGLGLREIVFLQGSIYLGLNSETAVLISLLFFLVTVLASAWGMVYVFSDPLTAKKTPVP
jgi:uncharacterized membrane protein YbhN (UPF0104 family)